jgi:hypothetical protein
MNASGAARLRLECLETRSLLSAIGLPWLPAVAPPPAIYQSAAHSVARAVMQDAVVTAATMPRANPILAADQLSPVPAGDAAYVAPATGNPVGNPAPPRDFHATDEAAKNVLLVTLDVATTQNVPITLTIDDARHMRFPGGIAADAPPAVDPAVVLYGIDVPQLVSETTPLSREPASVRGPLSRVAEDVVPLNVDILVSSNMDPSAPPALPVSPTSPVKSSDAVTFAASDTSKVGDQTSLAAETTPLAFSGMANPAASGAAFSDAAISNSLADGFITLDASAAAPRLGTAPSYNAGFQGVGGAELERGIWLSDSLPTTRKTADPAKGNDKAAAVGENPAVAVASRPAVAILQPVAESVDGGGIELAMAAPLAAGGEDALPARESDLGDAASQSSEIRPESGVGLFCDIEVATAPALPIGGTSSTGISYLNAGFLVDGTGLHGSKLDAVTEIAPPLTKSSQAASAWLAGRLPLLLGVTVLVSRGGLRLEEKVSERDRRLYSIEALRRPK